MNATQMLTLCLTSPEATCRFAARLGARLMAGDLLLLEGGIGAGKTHFSRCLIQSRLQSSWKTPLTLQGKLLAGGNGGLPNSQIK